MSQELDDEGKLVSMIMEANKHYRFAGVCDKEGKILWSSARDNVDKILTLEETKTWLNRSIQAWKEREALEGKLGKGKFAYVGYEKIRHITVPLKNGHILFASVEGKQPAYLGDLMKIVTYVEDHPSQR